MNPQKLILGTVQFGLSYGINNERGKPSKEEVFNILTAAQNNGIEQLDSAELYGDAYDLIGTYTKQYARSFVINTKFKITSGTTIREQLLQALERLNHQQVCVYFYHHFDDYVQTPDAVKELKALKNEGLIRYTGLSVYSNTELEWAIGQSDIDVIQLPFNLLDNFNQRGHLLRKAKTSGKIIQARSVFLQGLFFKEPASVPVKLQPLVPYLTEIWQLAKSSKISMQDMALLYAVQQQEIDGILIGVDTVKQLQQNIQSLQTSISGELIANINRIYVKETELLYPNNWV